LPPSSHDEFLELCALSTSGHLTGDELTADQRKRLEEHLAGCASCREAMKQYEAVAKALPAMAFDQESSLSEDPSWSEEQAEAELMQRLALEEELGPDQTEGEPSPNARVQRDVKREVKRKRNDPGTRNTSGLSAASDAEKYRLSPSHSAWRNVWTLCAAGVLLFAVLGISAYEVGIRRGVKTGAVSPPPVQPNPLVLEQEVSDVGHEREQLRAQVKERDQLIADLRRRLDEQSAEMGRIKAVDSQMEAELKSSAEGKDAFIKERTDLSRKLSVAEARFQELQVQLGSLTQQSSQDKQRVGALQAKVDDLTRLLDDRAAALDQQQDLLAHDRDIRELMGARDLYVAEVYDVNRSGETNKPYGRVFYTKGKSLIFYAYDLDQQLGVKTASSFQAWGRRGPDRDQALNLGVFYVDNAAKKRWVLRFDDPKVLAQIDAVFVTVEPDGGSHKPSNKSLLFAYLHIDPNHP
jgi:hypothetical protein